MQTKDFLLLCALLSSGLLSCVQERGSTIRSEPLPEGPWPPGVRVEPLAPEDIAAEEPKEEISPAPPPASLPFSSPVQAEQPIDDVCLTPEEEGDCQNFAMDAFYEALLHTAHKEKGAITRITHLGDSIAGSDYITSTARRELQSTFGDGGRGFIFAGIPRFYYLSDVSHSASGWTLKSVVSPFLKDDRYGMGGAAFLSSSAGASSTFSTSNRSELGQKASRFILYYLKEPNGGEIEIQIDGESAKRISLEGDIAPGVETLSVPEGPHKFKIRVTRGPARVFGAALETEGPGVVYDALGLVGNTVYAMVRADEEFWKAQLAARAPHLVILHLGANETGYIGTSAKAIEEYTALKTELIKRIRAAVPEASCLLYGPMDGTRPSFEPIIEAQRKAAKAQGCAFWDTQAFMGGKGSANLWKKKGFLAPDGIHPTPRGAEILGEAFAKALEEGLVNYVARKNATRNP